jgi:hypothetical protein
VKFTERPGSPGLPWRRPAGVFATEEEWVSGSSHDTDHVEEMLAKLCIPESCHRSHPKIEREKSMNNEDKE